jgi:dephospho-CoA kinase
LVLEQNDSASQGNHSYIVALTGGIASGKTLVSDEFARLGVPIIDTDVIAHQIVEPDQPALNAIVEEFGPDIIDASGELKRAALRKIIFSQPDARKKLESILHPRIRQEADKEIAEVEAKYCVLVIPLLVEHAAYPNINRILVVDVDSETQIHRLMARDGSSRVQAEQALASQAKREQRLKIADDVLDNSGTLELVRLEVARLNQKYIQLAKGS